MRITETMRAAGSLRTVKEISDLTGVSVRTLHYYDEIGLFLPTHKSEAGYRLYDDKALETLQQILFFREFDIPLQQIREIMENPALEKNQILQMQREMLVKKKERLERLIASIDGILKGENRMDFEVFSKAELEEMWQAMEANMNEEQKAVFIGQYGSMEEWHRSFLEMASSEQAQRNYKKVVEWYGSKEKALEASKNPGNSELLPAYQKRLETVIAKICEKKGQDVNSLEVKELVGEYDFVSKQLYQMEDVAALMLETADAYQKSPQMQAYLDSVHGEGATEFLGRAIEAFYRKK